MRRIRRNCILLLAGTLLALASLPAAAEDVLTIDFTGLMLKFDSGNIYDDDAYSLGSIDFYLNYDLTPVASLSGNVRADVLVQGVPPLQANLLAYTDGGSHIDLFSGDDRLLGLSIGEMTVTYSNFGNGSITVSGFASGITEQHLPGLALDPGKEITILLPGDSLDGEQFNDEGLLVGFTSSGGGTGTIEGEVPEPSSLILLLCLAASALAARWFTRESR